MVANWFLLILVMSLRIKERETQNAKRPPD